MTIPTEPAAYWNPKVSLSEVYSLRGDYTWHYNITGKSVPEADVPTDLIKLSDYAQPYRDPEPYRTGTSRHRKNYNPGVWVFDPRPGYSQNEDDYV